MPSMSWLDNLVRWISCRLQNGTTYNSYLIFGEDKTALVDVSHEKFRTLYMRTLREQLAKAGRSLDYVIVSHTEPDHSGGSSSFRGSSPVPCHHDKQSQRQTTLHSTPVTCCEHAVNGGVFVSSMTCVGRPTSLTVHACWSRVGHRPSGSPAMHQTS